MIWELHQFVLGIHILLAITWVGGILFVGWGVYPATKTMNVMEKRKFLINLMQRTHILFTLIGTGVILTGILLGTVLGPIKSLDFLFNSMYGRLWLTALFLGIFTLTWGVLVGYKQTMKMLNDDTLWKLAGSGYLTPLTHKMMAVTLLESVEVLGFIALLTCMLLL